MSTDTIGGIGIGTTGQSTTVLTFTSTITGANLVTITTIVTTSTFSTIFTTTSRGSAINGIQTAPSQSTNSGDGSLHLSNAKQSTEAQRSTAAQRSSRTAAALTPTSSPTSKGDGGLSTGAAIGIGVAISVFAIVALLAIAFFWYKRRSRRRQRGDRNVGNDQRDSRRDAKGAAAVREKKTKTGDDPVVSPYELSGKSRTGELETSANRHELDARQRAERRHELEGDYGERKAVQNLR